MLNADRYFDSDPVVRNIARELYSSVEDLPIISPHGHVDPRIFADNAPFSSPSELFIIPNHYIYRMLYSQGLSLEEIGVPTLDGTPVEEDHEKIWRLFAERFHLYAGTPSGAWLRYELEEVFGIEKRLDASTAMEIYECISSKLRSPEFLPRALFDRFNIEVLATTDDASSKLEHHRRIMESDWDGKVIPSFRPDAVVDILADAWKGEIDKLSDASGIDVVSYKTFVSAIENRREYFKSMGAVATDQGILSPYAKQLSPSEVDAVFQRALRGSATEEDGRLFTAHMLMEMARMSVDDGFVMQIHPGALRNHNRFVFERFGLDKGCDIPVATEYTENMRELLNKYGNETDLTIILFTLDESTYSRELAPLAGHYPALKLGPAWWFNDSLEGMARFRRMVTETAGFYNTVGFNDDTRALLSIPARHDLSRRMDANFLAGLLARHVIDKDEALELAYQLANGLVRKAYNL
jgi:glucuronate isomerase